MIAAGIPQLHVLGQVIVTGPSGAFTTIGRRQVAAVLALLWDERRPVRHEELAAMLWGEWDRPEHWAGALRGVLTKARRTLTGVGFDERVLVSGSGLARLELPVEAALDLSIAETMVREASQALESENLALADELSNQALATLNRPVAVVGEGDWIRRLHLRAETHARRARHLLIEAARGRGDLDGAIAIAVDAVALDPLDETATELLVRMQLETGRPGAARQAFRNLETTLHDELGVSPPSELVDLVAKNVLGENLSRVSTADRSDEALFLGRRDELEALTRRFEEVERSGDTGLVVIRGPAGIGKTRLARSFTHDVGVPVLWGRCHADSGEPFEPFSDAFGHLPSELDGAWSSLDPDVHRRIGFLTERTRVREVTAQRRTREIVNHDLVTSIRHLANGEPMVMVIDDLHWASGDTLGALIRILESVGSPILFVATERTETTDPATMAEVVRATRTSEITLGSVAIGDLEPLIRELSELTEAPVVGAELAETLWQRTGGFPYYLDEILRDARRRNRFDVDVIPEQVRAWIRHRIDALPADLKSLVEIAAVVGPDVTLDEIEAIWVGPPRQVSAGLERLERLGLLAENMDPDRVTFRHQITQEVVERQIAASRRARFHLRAADHLASSERRPLRHARIAAHYGQAGEEHRRTAALHGYLAAVDSIDHGAWDLAAEQLLAASNAHGQDETSLSTSILIARAWVFHALGRSRDAVELLSKADLAADRLRLPHEKARAALLMVGRAGRGAAVAMTDADRITMLEAALRATIEWQPPDVDHGSPVFPMGAEGLALLRTALEAELAWASLFERPYSQRVALLTGSLERARQENAAPHRLARVLLAQSNILCGPGQLGDRQATIDEVRSLPPAVVPFDLIVNAHLAAHEINLGFGDRRGALEGLEAARSVVERHEHPYWRWATETWQSLWLLVNGRLDEADTALTEAMTCAPQGSREAIACGAVQTVAIRFAQGRADEVLDLLAAAAEANPHIPAYRAVLALGYTLSGELEAARRVFDHFVADDFAGVPVDSNRLLCLAVLGDVAVGIDDRTSAVILDKKLEPDDELMVVLNCYGGGGSWWGPVARVRARLARLAGDRARADALFARAGASIARLGGAMVGQPDADRCR